VIQVIDWRFSTRPENLVELCNRALAELEKVIQQELGPNGSPTVKKAKV
jgi:hypothetical protein